VRALLTDLIRPVFKVLKLARATGGADAWLAPVRFDQLKIAERNILPGVIAMPLVAITLATMSTAWASTQWLILWTAAVAGCTPRYWLARVMLRNETLSQQQVQRWAWTLAALNTLCNIVWILPTVWLYGVAPLSAQMLFTLIAACSLAAGAALCAPSYPHILSAVVPYSLAMILPPLLQADSFHHGMAALALGYCVFMVHMARVMFVNARDVLLLRDDKDELIADLKIARRESDLARLRAEVASRESEQARDRADRANHAKSEFLANMSHELRTPLNAIIGFSEIMRGEVFGPVGSAQYLDYTGHIHASGHHLLCLINDVLDLSRIEAGRLVLNPIDIRFDELARDLCKFFEFSAGQRRVELRLEIAPALPLLVADLRAIKQVLINLMANAVKFTREGGSVTLAARCDGGGIEIRVSDTGVGIHPNDLEKVFETFGQGQHQIARQEKGSGLGLPIARGLVQAHGGTLRLTSEVDKGTTVTVTFLPERSKAVEGACDQPSGAVRRSGT